MGKSAAAVTAAVEMAIAMPDQYVPYFSVEMPASEVMERMVSAGVLNEDWQPQGLSNAEKGVLASCLATRLDIAHVWQTFSALWGMKPETLRTAFNKGMEQRKTAAFLERVKKVMSA